MRHSESIAALAKALAAAQAEYVTVPKSKTATVKMKSGGEFKYNYADLADCLAMAIPRLSKHGIAFSQPHVIFPDGLRVVTFLMHESGRVDGLGRHRNIRSGRAATVRGRVYLLPALRWMLVHRRGPGRGHRRAGSRKAHSEGNASAGRGPQAHDNGSVGSAGHTNAQRPRQQPHSPRRRC